MTEANGMALIQRAFDEVELFVLFSWRDWFAAIVPSFLFAAGPILTLPPDVAIRRCLLMLSWSILYIYAFTLLNQVLGLEEDRVNKPDRPIPSGRVSMRGAQTRCVVVWVLFLSTSLLERTIWCENLIHAVFSAFLSCTRPGGHWIGKNVVGMSVMGGAMLSTSRKIMGDGTLAAGTWEDIISLSVWAGLCTHVQDFRDQAGDRRVGRSTLPLAFGDIAARCILVFVCLPAALVVVCTNGPGQNAPWIVAVMHGLVGYRLLRHRDRDVDDRTYTVGNIASRIVLLRAQERSITVWLGRSSFTPSARLRL